MSSICLPNRVRLRRKADTFHSQINMSKILIDMSRELDIDSWVRKDHFNFFKDFDEPFSGVTINIDCTIAHSICKEQGYSFFLYYLHKSLKAANEIEAFRYRIIEDKVIVFDQINAASTIDRPNGTFGFSHIKYYEDFLEFAEYAKQEVQRVRNGSGLNPATSGANVIHYSAIPWIKFTQLSHARHFAFKDSCPKIVFGKMTETYGKKEMPVSIHAHHALMDGFHLGKYIETFQRLMDEG